MSTQQRNWEREEGSGAGAYDSGSAAYTFIEYTVYFVILLGLLYLITQYVLP